VQSSVQHVNPPAGAAPTCALVSPWKDFCPQYSSHSMMAKAYTSLARLTCRQDWQQMLGSGCGRAMYAEQRPVAAVMHQLAHESSWQAVRECSSQLSIAAASTYVAAECCFCFKVTANMREPRHVLV
jgi:hypothetical protein